MDHFESLLVAVMKILAWITKKLGDMIFFLSLNDIYLYEHSVPLPCQG